MTKLKEKGAALLYVSHRIDEIMKVCDDISILRDGVLVKSTKIKNLKTLTLRVLLASPQKIPSPYEILKQTN